MGDIDGIVEGSEAFQSKAEDEPDEPTEYADQPPQGGSQDDEVPS